MSTYITQDALVSPGWTRPVKTIIGLSLSGMFGLDKGRARLKGLLCIGYELRDKVNRGYSGFNRFNKGGLISESFSTFV